MEFLRRHRILFPLLPAKLTARSLPFLIGILTTLVSMALEVKAVPTVTLAWDPNLDSTVAGYRLYSGTKSKVYTQTSELGNVTSTVVSNLIAGTKYFFVVTAYNTTGLESLPSNEVSYTASTSTPSPTPALKSTPAPAPTPRPPPSATPIPTPTPATAPVKMSSPAPGSTFTSSSVTFQWSAGSATSYRLLVGSSLNGRDIYSSGQVKVLSVTVHHIPADGRTICVKLGYLVNGSWRCRHYTYKAVSL
jgi:Fibronectin type III domain